MIDLPPGPSDLLPLLLKWWSFPALIVTAVQIALWITGWIQGVRGGVLATSKAVAGAARAFGVLQLPSGIALTVVHFAAQGLLVSSVFSFFRILDFLGIRSWQDAEKSWFTGTWTQLWAAITSYRDADELSAMATLVTLTWVVAINMCRLFQWKVLTCLTIIPAAATWFLSTAIGGFFAFVAFLVWTSDAEYGTPGFAVPLTIAILAGCVQIGIILTIANLPARILSTKTPVTTPQQPRRPPPPNRGLYE